VLRLLKVDRSSYYRRRKERAEPKDDVVGRKVMEIFLEHSRRYGSRRIHAELQADGFLIGRHQVRNKMTKLELKAIQPRSFVPRTTNSRHTLGYSPNLLLGMALPKRPLKVIVGDITYLPLGSGKWCYLATWTDLYTRQILGWSIREDMTAELVTGAFRKIVMRRKLPASCIIHSDRGGQYASKKFRELLKLYSCRQSMSRAGETYDNAFAESLFSRFKAEVLQGGAFVDIEEARLETFKYIEAYYNSKRRHSSLGYMSPDAFELDHRQRTGNRAVSSPLTQSKPIDRKSTKGVNLKSHSCPTS
jgi:putative transposase